MIDFSQLTSSSTREIKTNPIEIYSSLDRAADTSELRASQSFVLKEWYDNHLTDKDIVIKMHTGDGKTLVGLLMLMSNINSGKGPALYVCPNKYLVQQVENEALRFGIPFQNIDGFEGNIPDNFLESKAILGVTIQKLFNGRTKFGLDSASIRVGCLVMDDAHACVESIKNAFTIRLRRGERGEGELYNSLLQLFHDDLVSQGQGSLVEIEQARETQAFMAVPYWKWLSKIDAITRSLACLSSGNFEEYGDSFFVWPLLKDCLEECQMFISAREIDILPYAPRVRRFGSFSSARQRIIMSATTQEDSFFIKGLDFDESAVKNPIHWDQTRWSGEKMILLPSVVDASLNRQTVIRELFNGERQPNYGVCSIIPTAFLKGDYSEESVLFSDAGNIVECITHLKQKDFSKKVVLVNRYDGIDLPDASCRLLVLDSKPSFSSLADRYENMCRPDSDIVRVRIAQKIEQGLGRAVRGEKDYCVILIIGADLVHFLKGRDSQSFFSPQTRKQVEIGLKVSELQGNRKGKNPIDDLESLIRQALNRDEGWKSYYTTEMDSNTQRPYSHNLYSFLISEKAAEESHLARNNTKAVQILQNLINSNSLSSEEKGWYLQHIARYMYFDDRVAAEEIQREAFRLNPYLFKPDTGVHYKKTTPGNLYQADLMRRAIVGFGQFDELRLSIDEHLANLSFGVEAHMFEGALSEIGRLLGFNTQRPDQEIKKGPDVLFCAKGPKYAIFECKNEVLPERAAICKKESGQMENHCAWFESEYGKEVAVDYYWVIATNQLADNADLSHEVRAITSGGLDKFKENVRDCFYSLKKYDISTITVEYTLDLIRRYRLSLEDFRKEYSNEIKKIR